MKLKELGIELVYFEFDSFEKIADLMQAWAPVP